MTARVILDVRSEAAAEKKLEKIRDAGYGIRVTITYRVSRITDLESRFTIHVVSR